MQAAVEVGKDFYKSGPTGVGLDFYFARKGLTTIIGIAFVAGQVFPDAVTHLTDFCHLHMVKPVYGSEYRIDEIEISELIVYHVGKPLIQT